MHRTRGGETEGRNPDCVQREGQFQHQEDDDRHGDGLRLDDFVQRKQKHEIAGDAQQDNPRLAAETGSCRGEDQADGAGQRRERRQFGDEDAKRIADVIQPGLPIGGQMGQMGRFLACELIPEAGQRTGVAIDPIGVRPGPRRQRF